MTENQINIIHNLSVEITFSLASADHYYCSEGSDVDKIDAYHKGYMRRVEILREIREKLENEFTTTMYDPR